MTAYKTTFGDYRYDFTFNGHRYTKAGFKTKKEALSYQEFKRRTAKLNLLPNDKINKKLALKEFEADNADALEIDKFTALKDKYTTFLSNPHCVLPDLIDIFFKDFGLNYSFTDLKEVILKKKRKNIPAKMRLKVFKRDGYQCVLCGSKPPDVVLHADHIVSVSRGGITEIRNLRTLCRSCNLGKSGLPYKVTG